MEIAWPLVDMMWIQILIYNKAAINKNLFVRYLSYSPEGLQTHLFVWNITGNVIAVAYCLNCIVYSIETLAKCRKWVIQPDSSNVSLMCLLFHMKHLLEKIENHWSSLLHRTRKSLFTNNGLRTSIIFLLERCKYMMSVKSVSFVG